MTQQQNTATNTATRATTAWPQRFGTLEAVQVKNGRKGRYARITVDCKQFKQSAFAFGEKLVEQVVSAGVGASVWLKGPVEPVERKNADGRSYFEDEMKVVYFKDNSSRRAERADEAAGETGEPQAEEAPAAIVPDDLTRIKGIGPSSAALLNELGIETFVQLAALSDEVLDAKTFGKKARAGKWRELAAAAAAETASA